MRMFSEKQLKPFRSDSQLHTSILVGILGTQDGFSDASRSHTISYVVPIRAAGGAAKQFGNDFFSVSSVSSVVKYARLPHAFLHPRGASF